MTKLGINIDHVATVRNARGEGHPSVIEIAKNVFQAASLKKTILASAESCTGGMLSTAITDIPGSSTVFECGFVT